MVHVGEEQEGILVEEADEEVVVIVEEPGHIGLERGELVIEVVPDLAGIRQRSGNEGAPVFRTVLVAERGVKDGMGNVGPLEKAAGKPQELREAQAGGYGEFRGIRVGILGLELEIALEAQLEQLSPVVPCKIKIIFVPLQRKNNKPDTSI